ncbi:hypothetical protein [Vibrio sagamiensis]|uniref:Conjugal transfer protein TrbC n=1 Tax=Vibrio sagamiensis NBRC 104589 TaxID=1219064 RepID=A0A511QIW8_9VIBR|nr:hypothetical protein [Vibrio sagamiensis]PNQ71037.1 hypothetical protein C1141_03010 [Vibrio agarivorans]PNQ71118.1 hypothetical protein C1141_02965 [Vibrio agarivorans]GEM77219.1 hypothetical protein VSA01S_33310 [Vibrio sagamiensis NBRC 104589]
MRRRYKQLFATFFLMQLSLVCFASVSLGEGGTGPFAKVGKFFQDIVDFLGGTGSMFVIFLAFAGAIALWVLKPKEAGPAAAWALRACIGAICIFGLGTLITWVKSF